MIILGGSLGNLFDRFVYNAVPDFIDFHIGDFHWFIFNPADIFITIGVFCLILVEFTSKDKKIMRKIILIILIVSLNSCESVKNALTGKKYESSDEFLIIKKIH